VNLILADLPTPILAIHPEKPAFQGRIPVIHPVPIAIAFDLRIMVPGILGKLMDATSQLPCIEFGVVLKNIT
jgi:hypothetical protein